MIEGVPDRDRPCIDSHVEAAPKPCAKHAWCVRAIGHVGDCMITPRGDMAPNAFDKGMRKS